MIVVMPHLLLYIYDYLSYKLFYVLILFNIKIHKVVYFAVLQRTHH